MFILKKPTMAATTMLFILIVFVALHSTEAQIGVCYGMLGDNLPCAEDTVRLYVANGIREMRLYDPDHDTLESVKGTGIKVMLGVSNGDIVSIGCHQSTADKWVETNVVPYADSIKYVVVGNEVKPYEEQASSMVPAMQNIQNALVSNHLDANIKVSTAIDTNLTQNSYPPSSTTFKNLSYITPIVTFLTTYDSPLVVNIQPYFAYISAQNMSLDFLLFTSCGPAFSDEYKGKTYEYQNLFDAIFDSISVALDKVVTTQTATSHIDGLNEEKKNAMPPGKVVGEASHPSKKGFPHGRMSNANNHVMGRTIQKGCGLRSSHDRDPATVENAKTFYTNLIKHVKQGSPMTQGQPIETYLFAMYDENLKEGDEVERHFGLFTPDMCPKYGQLNFN